MKYYLIVGEASGDLHASHLMSALKTADPQADFRFFGGDLMAAVGGKMVKHYKELAYMGFIPVLLHLRTILILPNLFMQRHKYRSTIIYLLRYGHGRSIASRISNVM